MLEVQDQDVDSFGFFWGFSPALQMAIISLCPQQGHPSVHVCVLISSSHEDTNLIGLEFIPSDLILTLIPPLKTYVQI